MIVNTAILTNQPVSLPVIVLAISHDGKVSDVTSAVTCRSTDENTVKVCFRLCEEKVKLFGAVSLMLGSDKTLVK